MSIQQIELGRLKLSHRMAERIALATGVSMNWLLAQQWRNPPTSQKDPNRPYTREVFRETQAEINEPRTHLLDVRFLEQNLAVALHRLYAAAEMAYSADEIVHFYYHLREFLEDLEGQWKPQAGLQPLMDVQETAALFHERLEKMRRAKVRSQRQGKPPGESPRESAVEE
jgi:hypothetical protein